MASQYLSKGLKRSALTVALGLCFVGGVSAQTNTAGAVTGQAASGDTITVTNPTTGFSRTITVGADGAYRFSQLPIGQYQVSRNGGAPRTVNVSVGTAANVDFVAASGGELDTIEVVGAGAINPIDVSSVESTTILTAEQIAKIPVPRDTTSVALLAPGTVRGDAAFGNLASFGGASVAENQYYVNGFNITNSFRSLNFSNVPFEAIQEQQIKTGGYGAEFGRSLGGVVNQITKRGTNDFHAGGNVFWAPEELRENGKDVFLTNGTLRQDNSNDTTNQWVASAWASGALIKDKLFAYGLVSYRKQDDEAFGSIVSSTNTSAAAKTPAWLLKMDWNITDSNLLELTAFSDKQKTDTDVYSNVPGSLDRGALIGTNFAEQGGDNYILKYTGFLTDTFTLSALYGHGEFSRSQHLRTAGGVDVAYSGDLNNPASGCPVITDARRAYRRNITGTYVSQCNITGGSIDRTDSGDKRDQFRIDAEWQLGDHLVRFGYDVDNYESIAGQSIEGGRQWRYSTAAGPDGVLDTPDDVDRVREQIVNQGSTNKVKQHAYYIQDSWNITDNFIAYLGGRWDTFENIDGLGNTFVKINNQFGPRLGFSWDVFGDSTFKVFGNAGRYALPLTPSVAVRGASQSLFTREDYNFTTVGGTVDPLTGAPLDAAGNPYVHNGATSRGTFRYVNGEAGTPKNPLTIASKNLDPMYQDEYILGMQKALTDHFSLGVRAIYRNLKAAIDDNCDYTAVMHAGGYNYDDAAGAWLNSAGEAAVIPNDGFPYCRMFNPGADAIFVTDFQNNGNLTTVTVPGATLSPKAKRKYQAMEFFFDGNWDKFFLQGSYTYAKSIGNTEGGVKSDIGQNNTSVTQDFDYIELTVDTYGYLPNDRRHSLKLFGNYEITDQWSVGTNLLVQSGRPINCLGDLDRDPNRAPGTLPGPGFNPHPYGSSFMRCLNSPVPRGTAGRLPWTTNIDMNVAYAPNWAEGLQFKIDVFNVLNSQKVTSVSEVAEDAATGTPLETYLAPASFQAPRSVRFMVQYDF
ncbi:TonB-dependent receptor [Lysobacter sp. KIS68-7]|uniref:TonB-dependent receptor n=1 Tax=Lysobacter sp. KIS68-7 TaxID=2904252 RepID=UPI001E5369E0|nr:TonB-dependent receptor [Lysobacter sp. KIS68-7]UHQ19755.1 TonB-dependent receptor [Lysobacter sp. KIS68-7]